MLGQTKSHVRGKKKMKQKMTLLQRWCRDWCVELGKTNLGCHLLGPETCMQTQCQRVIFTFFDADDWVCIKLAACPGCHPAFTLIQWGSTATPCNQFKSNLKAHSWGQQFHTLASLKKKWMILYKYVATLKNSWCSWIDGATHCSFLVGNLI